MTSDQATIRLVRPDELKIIQGLNYKLFDYSAESDPVHDSVSAYTDNASAAKFYEAAALKPYGLALEMDLFN